MATVTSINVNLNVNEPISESEQVITLKLSLHPDNKLDILRNLDVSIGTTLAELATE